MEEETGRPPISPALLLMMLGRQLRERIESALRAEGLSLRHFSALGHLAHQPGLSYSELARRDGITTQSMQSTLLQLQEMGARMLELKKKAPRKPSQPSALKKAADAILS